MECVQLAWNFSWSIYSAAQSWINLLIPKTFVSFLKALSKDTLPNFKEFTTGMAVMFGSWEEKKEEKKKNKEQQEEQQE